eukprot:403369137
MCELLTKQIEHADDMNEDLDSPQMSHRLFQVWQEDLKPYMIKQTKKCLERGKPQPTFKVRLEDFFTLWYKAIQAHQNRRQESFGCCGQRGSSKGLTLQEVLYGRNFGDQDNSPDYPIRKNSAQNNNDNSLNNNSSPKLYKPIAKQNPSPVINLEEMERQN